MLLIMAKQKLMVSTRYIANRLNISQRAVRSMLQKGIVPGIKAGGVWRVETDDLDELLRKKFGEYHG